MGKCPSKWGRNLWSTETRIGPFRFWAGYHRRQLNLALIFCVNFVLYYISFDWWMCAFVVLGLVFFPYQANQARRLAWETSSKWQIFCLVGRKTTTPSISLCYFNYFLCLLSLGDYMYDFHCGGYILSFSSLNLPVKDQYTIDINIDVFCIKDKLSSYTSSYILLFASSLLITLYAYCV